MRVLLINPHYPMPPESLLLHPPLAYAYMASELKRRGHEVTCLDLPMRTNNVRAEANFIQSFAPGLVGVTCVTQSYCQALEILRFVKQLLPTVPTVIGGPHVTFTAEETLARHADIDYVMRFDADTAFADLVDALAEGGRSELGNVAGLVYRDANGGGRAIANAPPSVEMDLDVYPGPDRSIFDLNAYLEHDYETVLMTSRGCPSKCSFCSTTVMGRRYRHHGVVRVVDEFQQLREFGFTSFFIGDDTFPADARRTIELCDEIERRKLDVRWTCNMRILDAQTEVLDAMVRAGAYRVFTGIETVKKQSLRAIRKGTTLERIHQGVQRVKAAGLEIHTAYIVGVPGDTDDDLRATLDFIKEIQPTVATFNTIEVRPGTDMFIHPEKYGLIVPDRYWYETTDWMERPMCETADLSQDEIKQWVYRCYFEFCSGRFGQNDDLTLRKPTVDGLSELIQ